MITTARLTVDALSAGQRPGLLQLVHDGKTVRKDIAGYAGYVWRLWHEGFGAC
jgi:hypothetical protein